MVSPKITQAEFDKLKTIVQTVVWVGGGGGGGGGGHEGRGKGVRGGGCSGELGSGELA